MNVKIQITIPNADGSTSVGYVDPTDITWEARKAGPRPELDEAMDRAHKTVAKKRREVKQRPVIRKDQTDVRAMLLEVMETYEHGREFSCQELMKLTGSKYHARVYVPLEKLRHDGKVKRRQLSDGNRVFNRYRLA